MVDVLLPLRVVWHTVLFVVCFVLNVLAAIGATSGLFLSFVLVRPFSALRHQQLVALIPGWYFVHHAFLMEYLQGKRMRYSGDRIRAGEDMFIISNHQCAADFIYLFVVAFRGLIASGIRFFAKHEIKFYPVWGWGMHIKGDIFIKRDWTADQNLISEAFAGTRAVKGYPLSIFSFLEGTRATPAKVALSREFEKQRNLPPLKHLIQPRTKGFTTTLLAMDDMLDSVIDVTMAFPGMHAPHIVSWYSGAYPRDVFLHIRRYPVASLPKDEEKLKEWVYTLWQEKDALLDHFATHGSFPGEEWDNTRVPLRRFWQAASYTWRRVVGGVPAKDAARAVGALEGDMETETEKEGGSKKGSKKKQA